MSSKRAIIDSINAYEARPVELPDVGDIGIIYEDPYAQFAAVLETVGGRAIRVAGTDALRQEIANLDVVSGASSIYSKVASACESTVDIDSCQDSHDLPSIDVAVIPGHFAVAENGAVWVTDRDIKHRVVLFIAEHMILTVNAKEMVHNMHEAYRRLSFDGPGYGVFMSGPSKTADIEQSLVIGAQGARSLHVFLVDEQQA